MNTIQEIYKLRDSFALLGLTGRTGSGCDCISDILSKEDISPYIQLVQYDQEAPHPNILRKHKIVNQYIERNWKRYTIINYNNVVLYFALLINDFSSFSKFLISSGIAENSQKENFEEDEKVNKVQPLQSEYETLAEKVQQLDSYIEAEDFEQIDDVYLEYDKILQKEIGMFKEHLRDAIGSDLRVELNNWSDKIRMYNSIREIESREQYNEKAPSCLAHKINRIIKFYRAYNKKNNLGTFIAIDSIRNPYEVLYFRERYAAFYLMSINIDKAQRVLNLKTQGYDSDLIEKIDKSEGNKDEVESCFQSVDLDKCIEMSDIHLSVGKRPSKDDAKLLQQLFKYLALIYHPGLIPPSAEERIMQIAYTAKLNSGCLSRQVGAVVTNNFFSTQAIGWNTVAEGQTPCSLRSFCDLCNNDDSEAFSDYEKNDKDFIDARSKLENAYKDSEDKLCGLNLPYCFKDIHTTTKYKQLYNQVHTRSLHAEENAFLQLAKYGTTGIKGGYLFTTASCCELCAKKAYQLGIKQIYYIDSYPGISDAHILHTGMEETRPRMVLFQGAVGRAYINLFNPIIPYKDELAVRTGVAVKKVLGKSTDTIRESKN